MLGSFLSSLNRINVAYYLVCYLHLVHLPHYTDGAAWENFDTRARHNLVVPDLTYLS